ncbi:polysaccharide deacetylase family protein [Massilia sp. B-10]|nr:polysaccharide deacetylase family protein [Massilia sp. B-10]
MLLCLVLLAALPVAGKWRPWSASPGPGARAAVSLAYDDALDSQLDNALPALDKVGLRATFYLQLSNPSVGKRLNEWRAAAGRGHELGNHTLFHQCSSAVAGRSWVQPHRDLVSTSVAQMRDQILLANTMLQAIDGRRERTLALPCGEVLVGGRAYPPAGGGGICGNQGGGGAGGGRIDERDRSGRGPRVCAGRHQRQGPDRAGGGGWRPRDHGQFHVSWHRRRLPGRVGAGASAADRLSGGAPPAILDRQLRDDHEACQGAAGSSPLSARHDQLAAVNLSMPTLQLAATAPLIVTTSLSIRV